MRANETDSHCTSPVIDFRDESVLVPADLEIQPSLAQVTRARISGNRIIRVPPVRSTDRLNPARDGTVSIRTRANEIMGFLNVNNIHNEPILSQRALLLTGMRRMRRIKS